MSSKIAILSFAFLFFAGSSCLADTPPMATTVRVEALRSQQDPNGRPLPLVAGWPDSGITLDTQIRWIKEGYPILPWITNKSIVFGNKDISSADQDALKILRGWNIPFALISTEWEGQFYLMEEYKAMPVSETGLGMNIDGSKMNVLSPFSPIAPWHDLGQKWTADSFIKSVQSIYPDPPSVFFISNNEAKKLDDSAANTEKRFLDLYGTETSDDFKRKIFGNSWIDRYLALFKGMREALSETAWKANSKFIGYDPNALDHFGRWWGWRGFSLTTEDRITPDPFMWDGQTIELYDNNWEQQKTSFSLWSMQSESMNLVFIKDEIFRSNPDFWYELIFWDGYSKSTLGKTGAVPDADSKYDEYQRQGVEYTPDIYQGWVQYNLWLLVPRVAREFRWNAYETQDRFMPYFQRIMNMVRAIHEEPTLNRFWKKGELVANPSRQHPFQYAIPEKWIKENRWYHLSTNLDPAGNNYDLKWPIWTLARVIGDKPNREWLVYAHATMNKIENVQVTIPDYKTVELKEIAVEGSFFYILEATGAIKQLGNENGNMMTPSLRLREAIVK